MGNKKENDDPQATRVLCPKCKGSHGSVVKVQLRPQAVTMNCMACGHQWFIDEPSETTH